MVEITVKNVWSCSINVCGIRLKRWEEKSITDNSEVQSLISGKLLEQVDN